jgi:hypothetical protein
MLELGTFGSVRGVPGNGYPYRNPRPRAEVQTSRISARKLTVDDLPAAVPSRALHHLQLDDRSNDLQLVAVVHRSAGAP